MNKQNGIIAGIIAALSVIFALLSLGALDFRRGQGFTAWAALVLSILSAAYVFFRAYDITVKWIWIVVILIIGIIPVATFWAH